MQAKERLIVALDVDTLEQALELIDLLAGEVEIFKVGISPFTSFGHAILEKLESKGKKCFLDLKVHDIPNTARNAARSAAKLGICMMNFHCLGGKAMLEAAAQGAKEVAGENAPILLGVTLLTSMDKAQMKDIGLDGDVETNVLKLARLAKQAGLGGVVASAKEAKAIKLDSGKDFIVVTPGVRPQWAVEDDQKRVLTPKEAIQEGADYIVVGRPIIQADDPLLAAKKIIEEME